MTIPAAEKFDLEILSLGIQAQKWLARFTTPEPNCSTVIGPNTSVARIVALILALGRDPAQVLARGRRRFDDYATPDVPFSSGRTSLRGSHRKGDGFAVQVKNSAVANATTTSWIALATQATCHDVVCRTNARHMRARPVSATGRRLPTVSTTWHC